MAFSIDTTFVFTTDTPPGKDPDSHSPTLRRYHQQLWSKPLPSGAAFYLSMQTAGKYLHHQSDLGEFSLSSDAVIPSFRKHPIVAGLRAQMPQHELEQYHNLGYTIGGMMIFPSNKVEQESHHQWRPRSPS